jgi:hypothetical protein
MKANIILDEGEIKEACKYWLENKCNIIIIIEGTAGFVICEEENKVSFYVDQDVDR